MRMRALRRMAASYRLLPSLQESQGAALTALVAGAIPRVSATTRRVVEALVSRHGRVEAANTFAQAVGLRNRYQLRRVLAADGLPCLEDLAGWFRILEWVADAEDCGMALSRRAVQAGQDPATWYRTVKRLTGRTWREVRALGHHWVVGRIAALALPYF